MSRLAPNVCAQPHASSHVGCSALLGVILGNVPVFSTDCIGPYRGLVAWTSESQDYPVDLVAELPTRNSQKFPFACTLGREHVFEPDEEVLYAIGNA
jgi:hypothetical protein